MDNELVEKVLKIINTDLDKNTTPAEILALKEAKSLETGLNLILGNKDVIINFNIEEYQKIDWSKVPVDTPIFVRNSETEEWRPRHFCNLRNNIVYAYDSGLSSHTADYRTVPWSYAKLANPAHIETDKEEPKMRLIDADALKDIIREGASSLILYDENANEIDLFELIDSTPTYKEIPLTALMEKNTRYHNYRT